MAFQDRTAGLRDRLAAYRATDPRHTSDQYRELHNRKAALVREGDKLLAGTAAGDALPAATIERVEAINAELADLNDQLAVVERQRDERRGSTASSTGRSIAIPSEVLRLPIGLIGLDQAPPSASALFGEQASMAGWPDAASWFRAIATGQADERLIYAAAGMTEGVPSEGGFLVPQEFVYELMDKAIEAEIVRPRATVEPMKSNSKVVAGFDLLDRTGGSVAGFVAQWLGEATAGTVQKGKTRAIELNARKLAIFTQASNELGEDGRDFDQQLTQVLTAGLAWGLDDAFLTADGVGKPLGALNDPALVVVAKESGQTADTIVTANVLNMWARLHPACAGNAVWVTNPTTLPQLMALVLGTGTAVSLIYQADPSGRTFGTLMGRPVLVTEKVPVLGDQGDLLLADFSQYVIGLRKEIILQKSQHVGWQTDESGYRIIARVDGQGKWNGPYKPKTGATLSWAVTLAARA